MLYVTMTDKFMSGWGPAEGKINKYIVTCETLEQAATIERNAKQRDEMKCVNICHRKPHYHSRTHHMTLRTYAELGEGWKK